MYPPPVAEGGWSEFIKDFGIGRGGLGSMAPIVEALLVLDYSPHVVVEYRHRPWRPGQKVVLRAATCRTIGLTLFGYLVVMCTSCPGCTI